MFARKCSPYVNCSVNHLQRGKIILEKGKINESIWKERDSKKRITFLPTIQFNRHLGLKPAFIIDSKATKWTIRPLRVEHKNVIFNGNNITLLRKEYDSFVTYFSKTAWMNSSIWEWEMQRLHKHLRAKYPGRTFGLMLDNVGSHKTVEFPNLRYVFLPKNSTAITQPLDCSVFAVFKNKYASWLMKTYIEVGAESVTMEQCIQSCASIFNGLDIRVINDGFKKTKIEKFQSEETLQIEISRDEQLLNVIERMEKFRCDDSDDE